MSTKSAIDPRIVQAYLETDYRVLGDTGFTLRVGEPCTDLLAAHARHRVACSAFLTACNPFSRVVSADENGQRQARLEAELRARSLPFVDAVGQHPDGGWPAEPSFLVFGLALEAAKVLGARIEQNAIVWSDADAAPRLILLR